MNESEKKTTNEHVRSGSHNTNNTINNDRRRDLKGGMRRELGSGLTVKKKAFKNAVLRTGMTSAKDVSFHAV